MIEKYLSISGSNAERISLLQELLPSNDNISAGLNEVQFLLKNFEAAVQSTGINENYLSDASPETNTGNNAELFDIPDSNMKIDFTLARGLNYYTGIIFEAKAPSTVKIGSIGGGGRYDDLTSLFGVPNIPGVGISFGVDRIFDVMDELGLFPEAVNSGTRALFFNLGESESAVAFLSMQKLRSLGISCELFPEQSKFDKQFKYAEKKNIPYVIIIGSKELESKSCVVRDLRKGEQNLIPLENLQNVLFI